MKKVTFQVSARVGTLYNPGEHASFDDDVADALVRQGYAVAGIRKGLGPDPRPDEPLVPLRAIAPAEVSPATVSVLTAQVMTAGDASTALEPLPEDALQPLTPSLAPGVKAVNPTLGVTDPPAAASPAGMKAEPTGETTANAAPGLTTQTMPQAKPEEKADAKGGEDQPSFIPSRPGKPTKG
ncbi:hypothetical protein [Teichococcus aestuarii]|uniref:hypothetical protein n=1 Tax=Teichococcus aestuarii TaxID=568898 RepID=UPI003615AF4E